MRKILVLLTGLLLLAACSTTPSTTSSTSQGSGPSIPAQPVAITADHVPDQIVIGYQNSGDLPEILSALGGARVIDTIPGLKAALVELPSGTSASQALGILRAKKPRGMRYAQPNFKHPLPTPQGTAVTAIGTAAAQVGLNDPLEAQKWDHDVMQAADAWATDMDGQGTTPDGSGVVIGVVDTGIDGQHPDLAGAFVNGWDATGCFSPSGLIPPGSDASTGEIHGTHVAGIAAARGNNNEGVAGVAYNATLMDIKVFCGPFTSDFTIAQGVWAAITDADGDGVVPDILTMSLGGKGYGQVVKDALDSALTGYDVTTGQALPAYDDGTGGGTAGDGIPDRTVTITVAMGNSFQDEVQYPAGYPGIIAVGATNGQDQKADFSTSGGHISVSAPGVDILSTWPRWTGQYYYRISGTSMATPEVSGAVALIKQFLPAATPYEVRRLLESTADDIGPPGFDRGTGWGRINLKKLVDKVKAILAQTAQTEKGGVAKVTVTTENGGVPLPAVDVQLLQNGEVKYLAKTNDLGEAIFADIAPGTYDVMVSGQDITDFSAMAAWPFERTSWDSDGDPNNGVTPGTLTVNAGSDITAPDTLTATLNSTMQVTIEWAGTGDPNTPNDLDLAILEAGLGWNTPKVSSGQQNSPFNQDDDGTGTTASETYTLPASHTPSEATSWPYIVSVDATNASQDTQITITVTMNGITKRFGPIPIAKGSDVNTNLSVIYSALSGGNAGFTNLLTVY